MKRVLAGIACLSICACLLAGCRNVQPDASRTETETDSVSDTVTETETETQTESGGEAIRLGGGSFRSVTGTALNLRVDWEAFRTQTGEVELTLSGTLECYSIDVGARPNMGNITVGTDAYCFSTDPMTHTENTKTEYPLFLRTCRVGNETAGETLRVPIRVTWPFNGTYHGMRIDVIAAEQTVSVPMQ